MNQKPPLKRDDIIYPELSYKLVGYAYEVYDSLGPGHSEKTYQKAYAVVLRKNKHDFKEQAYYPVVFQGEIISKGFLDFEIEGKVIIELKKDQHYSKTHIEQVLDYMKRSKLKLGIIINFTKSGVKFKRIVNVIEPTNS
jgi:GxxExxY protein